ncbi:DUF4826 family protein [Parashewanella tropica]|uniref:DUF4826 family protein n=1 Tax=Parashewanella tropica TaxID=2547970 RepID=UPI00105A323F
MTEQVIDKKEDMNVGMKASMTQPAQPTQEQIEQAQSAWVREQFQKANRFMAEKGIIPHKVHDKESRYLVPFIALWKMETKQPTKKTYWVLSGDLPSDIVEVSVAKTAREAVRHFSMTWQMKAENLIRTGVTREPTQAKYANLLISRAEDLYKMQADDKLWQEA